MKKSILLLISGLLFLSACEFSAEYDFTKTEESAVINIKPCAAPSAELLANDFVVGEAKNNKFNYTSQLPVSDLIKFFEEQPSFESQKQLGTQVREIYQILLTDYEVSIVTMETKQTVEVTYECRNASTLEKEIPTKKITYTDDDYNFTLAFPESWKDFEIAKRQNEENNTLRTSFGLPDQKDLFIINLYSEEEWAEIEADEGLKPVYLGQNAEYVFAYEAANDAVNELMIDRMKEFPEIIETFELR